MSDCNTLGQCCLIQLHEVASQGRPVWLMSDASNEPPGLGYDHSPVHMRLVLQASFLSFVQPLEYHVDFNLGPPLH